MQRGGIYLVRGKFDGKDRPAVIVSSNAQNEWCDTVQVVYMTTQPRFDCSTHVLIRSTGTPATLLCEKVRPVDHNAIGRQIGQLTENEIEAMNRAIAISLGVGQPVTTGAAVEPPERPQMVLVAPDQSAEIARLEAERDIYRDMYRELLDSIMEGGKQC